MTAFFKVIALLFMVFCTDSAQSLEYYSPYFDVRFESIKNGMSRLEVLGTLGRPQRILNLKTKASKNCNEPLLKVETGYEQWDYGIDASYGVSGFAVWFSKVNNKPNWLVVGKVKGFGCL